MAETDPLIAGGGVEILPEPAETPFELYDTYSIPLPDPVVNHRADKYDYALAEASPGKDQLKYEIQSGDESISRKREVDRRRLADEEFKIGLVREYINQAGQGANQEEIDLIMSSTADELKDPETFYEKIYSRKMIADTTALDYDTTDVDGVVIDDSILSQAREEDMDGTINILESAERIQANKELDLKVLEEVEGRWANAGVGATVSNYAEFATPFFSWYNMTNLTPESEGILLGNNLESTYEQLNLMPVDERHAEVRRIVSELENANPLDAMHFIQGMISYSNTDKFLNNAVSVMDATLPLPVVGVIPARGYTAGTRRLADMTRSVLKAGGQRATDPIAVADATGVVPRVALMKTIREMGEMAQETIGTSGAKSLNNMLSKVKTLSDPINVVTDIGKASQEYADRLLDTLQSNATSLFKATFQEVLQAGRLGEVSQAAASEEVKKLLNISYGRGSDVVIDVAPVSPDKSFGNASYVKATIGNKDATLFDSIDQAMNVNKNFFGFKGAKVKAVGGKYALEINVPVNETALSVREALEMETAKSTPRSLATLVTEFAWGGLRGAKDVISPELAREMDSAIIGGSRLAELARQVYAPISRLSKQETREFQALMEYQRDFKPGAGQPRGKFSNTLAELDRDYQIVNKRLPTDKERDAYFAAVQLNDIAWTVTNAGLFRDKSRKGFELFDFGHAKPTIEGVRVRPEDIWKHQEDAGIVIMDDVDPSLYRYTRRNWMSTTADNADDITRKEFQEMLDSGQYKIVQLSDVGMRAFKEMFKESDVKTSTIEFVVTKNMRTSPLEFEQIPYRPGGHVELDDGYFVSQANINRVHRKGKSPFTVYSGDKNLYHFMSKQEGDAVIANLEHARKLYSEASNAKDVAARVVALTKLNHFLKGKAGLPHTYTEFVRMFKGKNKKFNVDEPFRVRRKNESLEQLYKLSKDANNPNWINRKESPYNLYKGGVNLEWAGERGDHLFTIVNEGDTVAPVYNYKPARHVNPLVTLQRSSVASLRGRIIDDFKHQAAERYIAEFGDVLKSNTELQRSNPFKALIDGDFVVSQDPQQALKISAAKASRRATLEFLQNKTELGRHMDVVKGRLMEKILKDKGELATRKTLDMMEGWKLGAIKDPIQFMRSVAFHQKLGLFNPVQLFLQAQTVVHTIGVAGVKNGMLGFEAAMAQRMAMLGPQHLKYIAGKTLGWKPDDFVESYEWAQKSGWFRVGKEVAVLSDYLDENLAHSKFSKFLEYGKTPFAEGERITRMTAWNAAYLEWKAANKGKVLNGAGAKEILTRADLLSVNMTAASNASWQKGIIGIPTQFFAYQVRLMEQMLGKRLSTADKARAFATYSTVYGIPTAMGSVTGLWPIHETVKEWALQNGYEAEGPLRFLDEGLLSVITESLADEQYNVSERYGPGGLPFLEDIINGDTTIVEALHGVSGTTIGDNFKAAAPFVYSIASLFNPTSELYPITTQDFIDLLRNTSNTGNQSYNLFTALNVGKFYSKTGGVTDDAGVLNGLLNAFFGLTPSRITDTYRILENEKERKEFQKKGVKEITKELRKGLDKNLSVEDRMNHQKRAHQLMHGVYALNHKQIEQVLQEALSGNPSAYSIAREAARNSREYIDFFEKQQRIREELVK